MIFKSYLVEKQFDIIKNNTVLFYGENLGLINEFKKKIITNNRSSRIIKFTQDHLLKVESEFYNELNNRSLFEDKKVFFIDNANDKILNFLQAVFIKNKDNKIFVFSDILEKKSKLRNFFENEKLVDVIPCYHDNDITIKKIILEKLKGLPNLTSDMVNIIADTCDNDRLKLENEIGKIRAYSHDKQLSTDLLIDILNLKENNDFKLIRDTAILGDKVKTNNLLCSTVIELEKCNYYLSLINQRLIKLREVVGEKNIEIAINNLKPSIFWKDKPIFNKQASKWKINKLNKLINDAYTLELKIKSDSNLNKKTLLKKFIVSICDLANAA